jgi:hypothetical protein
LLLSSKLKGKSNKTTAQREVLGLARIKEEERIKAIAAARRKERESG